MCNRSVTEMKKQFGKVTELNICCDPLFEVRNNNNSLKYTITIDYTQHGLCYDSLFENVIMYKNKFIKEIRMVEFLLKILLREFPKICYNW